MIDINVLTETELLALNHRIVERLKMLRQLHAHVNMLEFRVGERVFFKSDRGHVEGVLTRYNRKTVTVITDDGHRWNVAPHFLEHVKSQQTGGKSIKRLS